MKGFRKPKIVDMPGTIVAGLKTMKDSNSKEKKREQAKEDVEKEMGLMRDALYGLSETETDGTDVAHEVFSSGFVGAVLTHMQDLSFDTRKHFKDIIAFFSHSKTEAPLLVDHFKSHPELLKQLIRGIKLDHQTALVCCEILKTAFKHGPVCDIVLRDADVTGELFVSVENEEFAVSSSAFQILKDLLTNFPDVFMAHVTNGRERESIFLGRIHKLVGIGSVVHKRKVLALLEQLLSLPKATDFQERYVANVENLNRLVGLVENTPDLAVRMVGILDMFLARQAGDIESVLKAKASALIEAMLNSKIDAKNQVAVESCIAKLKEQL